MIKLLYLLAIAAVVWIGVNVAHHNKPLAPKPSINTPAQVLKPTEPHHDLPENATSAALFELTNTDRVQNGLPALTYDARLHQSAALKCQDLVDYHYFGHDRGQGIFVFFPKDVAGEGENLEQGNYPPSTIENAWMNSPLHRANILGHYDSVGFAECSDMVVEHFVRWPAITKGAL
jgi:uncharacterized protein YkwD